MTTETEPAQRSEIEVRWEMANYGRPTRFSNADGISLHPTKRHRRVGDALEEIAASLVDDGVWDEEMQDGDDNLADLIGETWTVIETLFTEWAARAPQRRAIIRAGWAAEKAAKEAAKAGTAA